MSTNRNIKGMNRDHAKSCLVKGMAAILVLALCVGIMSVVQADAASGLAKPKYKLLKREKKSATLKVGNSKGVTGYRIYLKTGKKGKWKLYDFALHSSKIKITKLKPGKVYYVKLRAWKTQGHSIRLSRYSKTVKINMYKKKTGTAVTPSPTPTPTVTPILTSAPGGDGSLTSGAAAKVPDATPVPSPTVLPVPSPSVL